MTFQAFENMVLKLVQETVSDNSSAEFFHGTLFVKTTEDQARSVFHKLSKYSGLGRVVITKITAGEYAIDFV